MSKMWKVKKKNHKNLGNSPILRQKKIESERERNSKWNQSDFWWWKGGEWVERRKNERKKERKKVVKDKWKRIRLTQLVIWCDSLHQVSSFLHPYFHPHTQTNGLSCFCFRQQTQMAECEMQKKKRWKKWQLNCKHVNLSYVDLLID